MDIINKNKKNNNKINITKIIIAIIISISTLIIFSSYIKVFASTSSSTGSTNENVMKTINLLDGLIGALPMIVFSAIKIILLFVMTSISWIIGATISGKTILTLDNILFNDLPLINLDFNPQNAGN